LLLSRQGNFLIVSWRTQTRDSEGGKMLSRVRGLFDCGHRLPFDDKGVKIFRQQHQYRFGERPNDAGLKTIERVKNSQRSVLKDRISVKNEDPGFHVPTNFS
jgi:hypothetical protein